MGSLASDVRCPDASDPSLVLTHPTAAEMERTWRLNHREWGGALDLQAYLQREPFLRSTPLAANGGMMHWILTEAPEQQQQQQQRSIFASGETIRKRVLYALPPRDSDGNGKDEKEEEEEEEPGVRVKEGLCYGIGSVYTYPEFRGRKYAARMLKELGVLLKTWPKEERLRKTQSLIQGQCQETEQKRKEMAKENGSASGSKKPQAVSNGNGHAKELCKTNEAEDEAACSALWSDIGKQFYANKGWPAYASEHVEFPTSLSFPCSSSSPPPKSSSTTTSTSHHPPGISSLLEQQSQSSDRGVSALKSSLTLTPVHKDNIARLCREDEAQLRRELARHARTERRTAFAFAPDVNVFRWHWAREEFIAPRALGGRPVSKVRGMIATVTSEDEKDNTTTTAATISSTGAEEEEGGPEHKTRMWAVWTRVFGANAASSPANNTLYILRLVIDDHDNKNNNNNNNNNSDHRPESLQLAFNAIMHAALDAARAWNCGAVHLWNPTPTVRDLIAASCLEHKFVDREVESIPSMMWYGPGGGGGGGGGSDQSEGEGKDNSPAVDWIANEKYCWC